MELAKLKNEKSNEVIKCEVCDSNLFKYKCPRCELRTCSLQCVKIHKKELSCSGERDVTAYVPLSKFNNLHLLSDYRFLEEVDRTITNCRRNPQKRYTRYQQQLPTHLYRLKSAATKRKINLLFLPQHFSRHKENKTILNFKTQEITWKIDLIFPQGEMIKVRELVNEKTKLAATISKYLDPLDCPEMYKSYLRFYHSSGLSDVLVLLKAERAKSPQAVYMLDLFSDINTNLTHKLIIENPVMFVIKKAFKDEYTVIEDEDACEESIQGQRFGLLGDFTPVGFFDSFEKKSLKQDPGCQAVESIKASACILRGQNEPLDENESNVTDDEIEIPFKQKNVHIPMYEDICNSLN